MTNLSTRQTETEKRPHLSILGHQLLHVSKQLNISCAIWSGNSTYHLTDVNGNWQAPKTKAFIDTTTFFIVFVVQTILIDATTQKLQIQTFTLTKMHY